MHTLITHRCVNLVGYTLSDQTQKPRRQSKRTPLVRSLHLRVRDSSFGGQSHLDRLLHSLQEAAFALFATYRLGLFVFIGHRTRLLSVADEKGMHLWQI